jgi:hypothetical protein
LPKMLFSGVGLLLGILFLTNLTLAGRYRFGIQEIDVGLPRDLKEDDLLLVIASTSGSGNNSKTWSLGTAVENSTIKWTNLTQEIEVPAKAANLSVAIGVFNSPGGDNGGAMALSKYATFAVWTDFNAVQGFAQSIVGVAASYPGSQAPALQIFNMFLGVIGSLLNCTGPVAIGNAIYAPDTLNNLNQSQKVCETKNYLFDSPQLTCGTDASNYTVTYCLERLDDPKKSMAVGLLPSFSVAVLSLAVALVFGSYLM